jgi:hypothetical protein
MNMETCRHINVEPEARRYILINPVEPEARRYMPAG